MTRRNQGGKILSWLVGLTIGCAAVAWWRHSAPTEQKDSVGFPALDYLDDADRGVMDAVESSLVPLHDCFAKADAQLEPFADVVLGWRSKGLGLWDALPGTSNDNLKNYLSETFRNQVLSEEELKDALQVSVKRFEQELSNIENDLLVKLRADLVDFPSGVIVQDHTGLLSFDEAAYIEFAKNTAYLDGMEFAGQTTTSTILSALVHRVIVTVASRLAASSGILALGASSSSVTIGVSLAAAVVIDWIVAKVWNWFSDPREELLTQLRTNLHEMKFQILGSEEDDGKSDSGRSLNGGLRASLRDWAKLRSQFRKHVILDTLKGSHP